ncbi:MAG: DNA gyrase subunit A [Candidatus Terrybacteria bacterium RIFCSPLOWO2_01_FULL_44_24]|uniref:DNA gyrase subunit A n=1 Tax=Candidatus Terrybacteria bacterium RIFCSPHIGHO2_01_FULL_43_35 TaxID=1802361 RepID=A0A1G2PC98_9BACT|nr:MAG: DNA gyrase subunit A [Candidatus Terrybacteria bacterium RIFCSPHIGHO2_01_FULL_43_35]OHA51965.1 MAG: DNA gyrase subunit A [Candidatus Terrybacteria bacterium RIFCSPLOWO2_01_FULL_44_24]
MSDIGAVQKKDISDEIQSSYLDYAMSVIVARALPDVRDGLKPVHRRILFAMHEMGLGHAVKFRKCAAVVGEVLGKYHPHGDVAVYDALVRMAQNFSLRYTLVSGQGNFGSIDGDAAAAMRYTESRLTTVAEELLSDIEKETVQFVPNYDGVRQEPKVLPAKLPNLLLNGSVGIAVGMATNIPPHNISEVIDGAIHLLSHPQTKHDELMKFIKGPDFPTGGIIYGSSDISQAYAQGRGPIVVRGKAEIIEGGKRARQIIISEIPFQVIKADLIEQIANLVHNKKLEGIRDVRDESDKEGLRVVIDLKSDGHAQKILNALFHMTDLQKTFHLNMLALVDGLQPQVLTLKSVLEEYIKHRREVVRKRTQYELTKAKERAHILEGLVKALDHIDAIIKLIKSSANKEDAHVNLRKKFGFSDRQAAAILALPLSSLARLERERLMQELKAKKLLIKGFEEILGSPKKLDVVIEEELIDLRKRFGDERRTYIESAALGKVTDADLIVPEDVIIVLTADGFIKRVSPTQFRTQKRGGRGVAGMEVKEEDAVLDFVFGNNHDALLCFSSKGRVFRVMVWDVPEGTRTSRGKAVANFLSLGPQEVISALVPIPKESPPQYLFLVTQKGVIKRSKIVDFANVRKNGITALALQKGDELVGAVSTKGDNEIFLITRKGKAVRFPEKDLRPLGRTALGVRGVAMAQADEVVDIGVIQDGKGDVLIVSENGFGKRTDLSQYRKQKRGGAGIKAMQVTAKTGPLVGGHILIGKEEELIVVSIKGQVIRTPLSTIPKRARTTQGVRLMKLVPGDKIASFVIL